ATGAPLTTHTGLRERGFGIFEGKTYAEIEQTWPEESEHWRKRTPHWAPAGGESLLQVRERITHTLQILAASH
ncbi:histidine phosphatase family protein, partial [Acinetobacter baumannii]|uniref:histidine phosphatase family protein n=1 Tax=Acinetobacter baumannii TaxID=470 RepID=UPI001146B790